MSFSLPQLAYPANALEPHMSAETLGFHHGKHHQAYVTNLNALLKGHALEGKSLPEIIQESYQVPSDAGLFNNASQHWNHIQFWNWMSPEGRAIPSALEMRLKGSFGSVDGFKEAFIKKGVSQFGSGWVWLVDVEGELQVTSTPNGVNPLCFKGQRALLGCDVWEHSYYIDYRNRRPDYLRAFVDHLANWDEVAKAL